jgi:hypothetical protein
MLAFFERQWESGILEDAGPPLSGCGAIRQLINAQAEADGDVTLEEKVGEQAAAVLDEVAQLMQQEEGGAQRDGAGQLDWNQGWGE